MFHHHDTVSTSKAVAADLSEHSTHLALEGRGLQAQLGTYLAVTFVL